MSGAPVDRPVYLDGASDPVFAVFHPAAPNAQRDVAVVLCPPFGWDDVCAYRSLREWAQRLAASGYPTIRLSYPSTGDSGGRPRDPHRLDAWTTAVAQATSWVRRTTQSRRVAAAGIELGGLIAYRAASQGAPIDDLALWATPSRGRALIRQLTAFSKLERSQFFDGHEPPPPLADGELEAGGFVLSADTVRALNELDLSELPLAGSERRRVLLLDRDGIAVDDRLRARLEELRADVTIASGPGYAAMTSHPQQAVAPLTVIEALRTWLSEAAQRDRLDGSVSGASPGGSDSAQLAFDDTLVRETPLTVVQPFGRLSAVLAEPIGPRACDVCVLLLNAGAVRRIGPNRMWVEAARRWAAQGVPTVRLDVEGIGEADGDGSPYVSDAGLYVPGLVPQVRATLDSLSASGIGRRFVLGGLCAGAYWSFHATLEDPRVIAALMINPRALIWDPALLPARDFRALISGKASWSKLREQASMPRAGALARWLVAAPRRRLSGVAPGHSHLDEVAAALERVRTAGKQMLFLFSDNEPLRDELRSSGALAHLEQLECVSFEYVPVRDHTLRPVYAQQLAHSALDRSLLRELGLSQGAAANAG